MTKVRSTRATTQSGAGIISDIGDFLKSHKVFSKAGKALTPFVSAWNPAAGVGVAGISAGLDQAGWGRHQHSKKRGKHGAHGSYKQPAVPVISANYGKVLF